jgi:hypothetical protein
MFSAVLPVARFMPFHEEHGYLPGSLMRFLPRNQGALDNTAAQPTNAANRQAITRLN